MAREQTYFCPECDRELLRTASGFLTCICGKLKLLSERDCRGFTSLAEKEARRLRGERDRERRAERAKLPLCGVEHDLGAARKSLWWVAGKEGFWAWVGIGELPGGIHAVRGRSYGRWQKAEIVTLRPLSKEEVEQRIFGNSE